MVQARSEGRMTPAPRGEAGPSPPQPLPSQAGSRVLGRGNQESRAWLRPLRESKSSRSRIQISCPSVRSGLWLVFYSPSRILPRALCYLPKVAQLRYVSLGALGQCVGLADLLQFHLQLPPHLKRT